MTSHGSATAALTAAETASGGLPWRSGWEIVTAAWGIGTFALVAANEIADASVTFGDFWPLLGRALPLAPGCLCAASGRHVIGEMLTVHARLDAYAGGCMAWAHGGLPRGQGCAPSGRDLYYALCCAPFPQAGCSWC